MTSSSCNSCPYIINKKTLIVGMGGGYDIYSCLPWYLNLSDEEKNLCTLANYSFTDDLYRYEKYDNEWIVEINEKIKRTTKNKDYFPEHCLAISLQKPIYAIRLIPNPILETEIEKFIVKHDIRQIILVDGGVDAMIYGDEKEVGSPLEDTQMIISTTNLSKKHNIPCKLICNALYVDDVSPETFLQHWNDITKLSFECQKMELVADKHYVTYKKIVSDASPSTIIHESILAAIEGHRGKYNNPRLYPERIDNPNDMPFLCNETKILWCIDANQYVSFSQYYQNILQLEIPKDITLTESRIENYLCILWQYWNRKIRSMLQKK